MDYFDILLAKKLEDDRDPKVEGLSVSANGRYHEDGVVYNPVIVNVQPDLITKSITQNGTYTASSDNADGYSSVDVHVEGYKITEVSGLPSPIATFSDGANEMPLTKLKCSIDSACNGAKVINSSDGVINSDNAPYTYRATPYNDANVLETIVGGTVAWNQLVDGSFSDTTKWASNNAVFTVSNNVATITANSGTSGISFYAKANNRPDCISGHKYFASFNVKVNNTKDKVFTWSVDDTNYNTNSLVANQMTHIEKVIIPNVNKFIAYIYPWSTSGTVTYDGTEKCEIDSFQIIDLTQAFGSTIADYIYSLEQAEAGSGIAWLKSYGFLTKDYYAYDSGSLQSVNVASRKVYDSNDTLVATYPLDSNLTLRGIVKKDANNNLYYDGDVYNSDGTITRNYEERAYQSGDESLTDAITDGTNTVVKLSTPTIESATPFTNPQLVGSTEEFVDAGTSASTPTRDVDIPCGHNSLYYNGNGYYVPFPTTISSGTYDVVDGTIISGQDKYNVNPLAIKSLLGTNNLWANTGDVVEASYWEEL